VASVARDLLGLIDLPRLAVLETADLRQRQIGEHAQKAPDIVVFGIIAANTAK